LIFELNLDSAFHPSYKDIIDNSDNFKTENILKKSKNKYINLHALVSIILDRHVLTQNFKNACFNDNFYSVLIINK
jgi:hypothetical protein